MKAQTELITIILEEYEAKKLLAELRVTITPERESHEKFPMMHELKYILKKEVESNGT